MVTKINLDKNGKDPLYKQLKVAILNLIWNNEIIQGELLPTQQELAESLGISKSTVRQCMDELANEGYIEKRRNRGTVVLNRKVNLGYSDSISDFNEKIKNMGMVPVTELLNLSIDKVDEEICSILEIPMNSKVINLKRLRKINDVPTVLIQSYIPYTENMYILTHDFELESLYKILSEHPNAGLSYVKRRLYASESSQEVSQIFEIPKQSALLSVETKAYSINNEIMEYSISYSPGDRNEYSFVVNV